MADDVKKMLRKMVEDVLAEMTGTGAAAGYNTPNAFAGKGDAEKKKKLAQRSMPGGTVVGEDESNEPTGEVEIVRRSLGEGRGRYQNFKTTPEMKTHAKISYGMQEANKMLREVEFLVGICERLKLESGTTNDSLWKRTAQDTQNIHKRLKEIARRVQRLSK